MRWPTRTVAERFWPKVDKNGPVVRAELGPCWVWTGCQDDRGRGQISAPGGKVRVHRLAWTLCNGEIPGGSSVLHRCDNPRCVNPEHLFLGTQADNIHDMWSKGRAVMPAPGSRWRAA